MSVLILEKIKDKKEEDKDLNKVITFKIVRM